MKKAGNVCELFCDRFNCSPERFEEKVFWLTLYPHAIPLARLLWHLNRAYFQYDLELICHIKVMTSSAEVIREIENFRYQGRAAGLLRGLLKVRISGRRLLDLSGTLFANGVARSGEASQNREPSEPT